MTQARDTDDPERLTELRWSGAIRAWMQHDPSPLQTLLSELPAPAFAVEFLRDVVAGKAQREKGRQPRLTPASERDLTTEVYTAWDAEECSPAGRDGSPRDRAIAAVAERHHMSADRLRGIVDKVRDEGLTREIWTRFMRRP